MKRQGETLSEEIPIFNQHLSFLSTLPPTVWLLPLGIFASGLYYRDEIIEQFQLVYGVVSNISNSRGLYTILGPPSRHCMKFVPKVLNPDVKPFSKLEIKSKIPEIT